MQQLIQTELEFPASALARWGEKPGSPASELARWGGKGEGSALSSHTQKIAHFKHLTETTLPALARRHRWPIRLDHCFKRICLDHAFTDVWYNHLPRPAERHLAGLPLARAIACAEAIVAQGLPALQQRNTESLRYRGKLLKHPTEKESQEPAPA